MNPVRSALAACRSTALTKVCDMYSTDTVEFIVETLAESELYLHSWEAVRYSLYFLCLCFCCDSSSCPQWPSPSAATLHWLWKKQQEKAAWIAARSFQWSLQISCWCFGLRMTKRTNVLKCWREHVFLLIQDVWHLARVYVLSDTYIP